MHKKGCFYPFSMHFSEYKIQKRGIILSPRYQYKSCDRPCKARK